MPHGRELSPHILQIIHLIEEGLETEEETLQNLLNTLSPEELSLVDQITEIYTSDTSH